MGAEPAVVGDPPCSGKGQFFYLAGSSEESSDVGRAFFIIFAEAAICIFLFRSSARRIAGYVIIRIAVHAGVAPG